MPTILLTGFDPFGGALRNPSGEVALALDGETVAGWAVRGVVLPTAYARGKDALSGALADIRPDALVMLGVFEGRRGITPERVAINLDDASVPDNDGDQRSDQLIDPDGPAAYFSELPLRAMTAAVAAEGLPSGISLSAGSFVCNHVFYEAIHLASATPLRAGFVHVPALPGMVPDSTPSMLLDDAIRGVRALLSAVATN